MKNCLVTLVDNNYPHELNTLISSLNEFFIPNNPNFDFFIFHEKGFIKNDKLKLKNEGKTIYYEIDFDISHLKETQRNEISKTHFGFSIGYRMMCRFFAGEIFKIFQNYDYQYMLRLDTDSTFYEIVNRNLFSEFEKVNASYGYIHVNNDATDVRTNLLHHIVNYVTENNLKTEVSLFDTIQHQYNLVYYNCFEMLKLSEFKNKNYMSFYEYLDDKNGFLKYRWGDHAIKFFYVNLFINRKHIHYFNDVAYRHIYDLKNNPFLLI